jgi:putative DNA primase/helicase
VASRPSPGDLRAGALRASYLEPAAHRAVLDAWSGEPDELGTLVVAAMKQPPDASTGEPPVAPGDPGRDSFRRTDAGNGEHFAQLYGERLRFDHRRRRWLVWAGQWWREDDRDQVRRLAKVAARDRYQTATTIENLLERGQEAKFAIGSENRQRLEATLIQAKSEPPIADPGNAWDADPWLLGVSNGIVDLRTGTLRDGVAGDRITLHTNIAYTEGATAPRWKRFLGEVFAGDKALIDYIWRAIGYSLTGGTSAQCLFMCHGTGANGKSVFLAILRDLLGQYGTNTPFSTFELHNRSSIPNDIAALAGKRLVTASETGEGVRLNEARLKALTGGDEVTARFLHGEFFTFQPVAKFWLAANHKPRVADDSYGFWRRVRLIPFTRQFTADADPALLDALRAELPGILVWAIQGAMRFQAVGLEPPAAVAVATETYRSESDPLGEFLEIACVAGAGMTVSATAAHKAYRAWAQDRGLAEREVLSATSFGTRMGDRFGKRHTKVGNVYLDVGLLADPTLGRFGVDEVKGQVKGFEHGASPTAGSAPDGRPSREDTEGAFTTRHPAPEGLLPGEQPFRRPPTAKAFSR